jgi:hypothetical protein
LPLFYVNAKHRELLPEKTKQNKTPKKQNHRVVKDGGQNYIKNISSHKMNQCRTAMPSSRNSLSWQHSFLEEEQCCLLQERVLPREGISG